MPNTLHTDYLSEKLNKLARDIGDLSTTDIDEHPGDILMLLDAIDDKCNAMLTETSKLARYVTNGAVS